MGITYGDYLIDSGHYDITPEQEREIEAREECARQGLDPDDICADGGVTAWMVVDQEIQGNKAYLAGRREEVVIENMTGDQKHVWDALQYEIEGVILRRLHANRVQGYTLEMSKEMTALYFAFRPDKVLAPTLPGVVGTAPAVDK